MKNWRRVEAFLIILHLNKFFCYSSNTQSTSGATKTTRNNASPSSSSGRRTSGMNTPIFPQTTIDPITLSNLSNNEDLEIKPGIAEMIREEERVSEKKKFSFN